MRTLYIDLITVIISGSREIPEQSDHISDAYVRTRTLIDYIGTVD